MSSETPPQRAERQAAVGGASDETYADTLRAIAPGCACETVSCVDGASPLPLDRFRRFDAVFFAGSPIQMHVESPETRAAAAFMRRTFEAGVPAFGSCAGLQIAAVAAGGTARPRDPGIEAGFVRGIVASDAGRSHPMLKGRPIAWDAPAMHSSEIDRLPPGAVLLAGTRQTPVQAVEIRCGDGFFWGVQYHPELTLGEIAASLRRNNEELIAAGLANGCEDIEAHAAKIDALDRDPSRQDLAWVLGVDEEIVDADRRRLELRNFVAHAAALAA